MKTTTLIIVFSSMLGVGTVSEVCYHPYGCFPMAPPWCATLERPLCLPPWSPEKINPQFFLLTRDNRQSYQVVSALNVSSLNGTNFKPSRKTILIVHGFFEKGDKAWLIEMCQNFLQVSDVNCFCVDWSGGSVALYSQAISNVRVVGAVMALFLDKMATAYNYPLSLVLLVGHSLGGHVTGECGKRRQGIGRIMGLDPAGPSYENTPPEVRLDSTDAILVSVLHTNGAPGSPLLGFGIKGTSGHIEIFPNGGQQMPGCDQIPPISLDIDQIIKGLHDAVLCSHHMSYRIYSASILTPGCLVAYPAVSYKDFEKGSGFPCRNGSCALMGYEGSVPNVSAGGQRFYLNTGDASNLCRWRFGMTVFISGAPGPLVTGTLEVSLCSSAICTPKFSAFSGPLASSGPYTALVDAAADVNPVQRVVFSWKSDVPPLLEPTLGASNVTVQHGPTAAMFRFCGAGQVTQGTDQTLQPCPPSSPAP